MSTISSLGQLLFGDTRRAILALLYGHSEEQFYLRDLVRDGRKLHLELLSAN